MRSTLRTALVAPLILATCTRLAPAQTHADSAHVAAQLPRIQVLTGKFYQALYRYCSTRKPAGYVCDSVPSLFLAPLSAMRREESLHVAAILTPVPTPTPTPTDTASSVAAPPELPRVVPSSRDPYPGKACTVNVALADDANAVINAAHGGDVLCFQSGATYPVQLSLGARPATDTGYVVLRTATTLPAEGTRMRPSMAGALAKIAAPSNATPVLVAAASASRYWIRGLELTTASSVTLTYSLVQLGTGTAEENTVGLLPSHIGLEQVYVHGQPTQEMQRCVQFNGAWLSVVDSWISECHWKGADAQAVGGWSGIGPYLISNNYLEGSGENVLIGGAAPAAEGLVASDVTIARNWIHAPTSWAPSVWTRKNLLELKSAHRVLVEGNVMDGSWADGQTGGAVLVKSSVDAPYRGMNSSDVTIRLNRIFNVGEGFAITGREWYIMVNGNSVPDTARIYQYPDDKTQRVRIEQNFVDSVNVGPYTGAGRLILVGGVSHAVADLAILRNTIVTTGPINSFLLLTAPAAPAVDRFDLQSNVLSEGSYAVVGALSSGSIFGTVAWSQFAVPGTWSANVLVRLGADPGVTCPAGTLIATSIAGALATGSGADTAAVNRATAGVVVAP